MAKVKELPLGVAYPGEDELNWVQKGGKVALEAGGTNLYFALGAPDDDESGSWLDGATAHPIKLTLLYFDVGTETIQIGYSSDAAAEIGALETIVTKGDTGEWKRAVYTLAASMRVGHEVYEDYGYADFRLKSSGLLILNEVRVRETTLKVKAVWQASEFYIDESYEGTETDDVASEAITSGKIADDIQSDNYVLNTSGWKIWRNTGDAEFNNVTVRGTLYATAGEISGTLTVSGTLRNSAGNPRWQLDSTGFKQFDSGGTQRSQLLNDGSGWLGSSSVFSWTAAGVVSLNGSAVVGNSLDAAKLDVTMPLISGLTLTANSPSAGRVAWSSFKVTYKGTTYTVTSGDHPWRYGCWQLSAPTVVTMYNSVPTLTQDLFILWYNPGTGTPYPANFAPFIYSDYIAAGTITATHISVSQLSAITADLGTITAGTITGTQIRTASSGARVEMHATNLFGLGYGGIGGIDSSGNVTWVADTDGRIYLGGTQFAELVGVALYSTTDLTVGNTTTETAFVSQTLRGNMLRAGGGLHGKVFGTWLNNTAGTRTLTIRFKYGATTISSPSMSLTVSATAGNFEIEFFLANGSGVTNSQKLMLHTTFFRSAAVVDESRSTTGTAAEDSTSDNTVEITAQWDAAGANATLTMKMFHADLVK